MITLREHKLGLESIGIPWVPLSCSRYENRTSTIFIVGDVAASGPAECKVSYSPGSPEIADMPTTAVSESETWAGLISRGVIQEDELPDGVLLGDAVTLTTLTVSIFKSNLSGLVQSAPTGRASLYYYEARDSQSPFHIISAGSFAVLETVEA